MARTVHARPSHARRDHRTRGLALLGVLVARVERAERRHHRRWRRERLGVLREAEGIAAIDEWADDWLDDQESYEDAAGLDLVGDYELVDALLFSPRSPLREPFVDVIRVAYRRRGEG